MKKILGLIVLAFMLIGCDNDSAITVKPGDPLVVLENIVMECDVPFEFKTVGSSDDTIVGVREGEGTVIILTSEDGEPVTSQTNVTIYESEWGVDVGYSIITPCPEPIDENITEPVVPINGECPEGYEVSNCDASQCIAVDVPVQLPIECGEGTELDDNNTCIIIPVEPPIECGEGLQLNPTTGLCDIIPPLECGLGLIPVEDECKVVVYPRDDEDCEDGYIEGPKGRMCFLESMFEKPTPK